MHALLAAAAIASGIFTMEARADDGFYAVRPWAWREKFPMVNRIDPADREAMVAKFKDELTFPKR